MRKKLDPKLLSEEVKRFRLISEYSFYTGESDLKEEDEAGDTEEPTEEPAGDTLDPDAADAAVDSIGDELGVDTADGDTPPADAETPPADDMAPAQPAPTPAPPVDDAVEVDVTSIVKGTKEAEDAANHASQNTVALMAKFNDLENKVAQMGAITQKIDTLEKEIVKRNPTPVEKLEMRSMDSFPYNIKLSDYWNDKEGPYDVMDNEKKEYVLTQDEVDSTYSAANVKQSFNTKPENLYEEEDI